MAKKTKFNLMDCLIILVVVALVAGGIFVLSSLKGKDSNVSSSQGATIRYTVELAKEEEEVLNAFIAAAEREDNCYVGEKERAAAVIKEVTYTPAKMQTSNAKTGEIYWEEIEDKYCINVTLESQGSENDSSVIAGSGNVLKVGAETSVKGKGYAGYGFIIALETVNE